MGGGQFLREVIARLRKYGHSDENIAARVFGMEGDNFRVNYVKNKFKLPGTFWAGKLDDLENLDMKFDVVIGNPPYQDSDKGYKGLATLWPKFVKKGISLLKEHGHLSFVTPASWMSPGSELFKIFQKYNLKHANLDCGKHFTIGSTFSYWILEKVTESNNATTFVSNNATIKLNLRARPFVPNTITPEVLSILEKTVLSAGDKFLTLINSECHSQRTDKISANATEEFKYPVRHTNSVILHSRVPHSNFTDKKVLFPLTGNLTPMYDDGTIGTGQNTCWITVQTRTEGENLIKFLTVSKLIRFVNKVCKWSGANNRFVFESIPKIDLTRTWTDAELYAHFGLTQEEIDYVESTVK